MTNHKQDDATDFVGLKSVQERRRRPHNATSMRAKAIVGHPLAAFARVRLWKKLLMAGIASGAIFGIYFIQQRHSVVHHQLVRRTDEPQRLIALETPRPTELETQRQAEEPATARQAAAPENERQAQLETQRQAERIFKMRLETATRKISVKLNNIQCKNPYACDSFVSAITIVNNSGETVSEADFGWAFVGSTDSTCPSTYPTKKKVQVNLRPGDLATVNMDASDGPPTLRVRYCVGVTGVAIVR